MSQRLLVGLSSVIFGLAIGCHHDNGQSTQPVASAGMQAGGQVGENGGGVGAGAQGQVGGVGAGAGAQVGANDQGVGAGATVGGQVGDTSAQLGGSASISRNDQNGQTGLACPMEIPGAHVAMTETKGGIALDFTTNGDVMELRQRVHSLAASQSSTQIAPQSGAGDMQGSGGREMNQDVTHVQTQASVQDLPNGARLIIRPVDPNQFNSVRQNAMATVSQLNQGDCSALEIYGMQLRAPNNGNVKANRVPSNSQSPNDPSAAPNPDNQP
jgi:hypothetical protein